MKKKELLSLLLVILVCLTIYIIISGASSSSSSSSGSGQQGQGNCGCSQCGCCMEEEDSDEDGEDEAEEEEINITKTVITNHDCSNRSAVTTSDFSVNLSASPDDNTYSYTWDLQIYACAGEASYDLKIYQETEGTPPTTGASTNLNSGNLATNSSKETGGYKHAGYEYRKACLILNAPDNPDSLCKDIPKITVSNSTNKSNTQPTITCDISALSTCGTVSPASVNVAGESQEVSITVNSAGAGSNDDCKDKTFTYTIKNSERSLDSGTGKFDELGTCSAAGDCERLTIQQSAQAGSYDLVITSNEDSSKSCTNSGVLTVSS
jgi:hypothetical protein